MTDRQEEFLFRVLIKQETYATISKETGVDRKILSQWWEILKVEREEVSAIRPLWRSKFNNPDSGNGTFEDFHKWYLGAERKCHYCEITEAQIEQLWKLEPVLTKRKKGRTLEIDRKKPNISNEDTQNLVFCCYWCNIAQTDPFSEEEFKKIGQAFKMVWEKRLQL